jgi:hypothetical protein
MSLSRRTLFHGVSVFMRIIYITKSKGRAGLTGAQLLQRLDVNISSSENNFYARVIPLDCKSSFVKNT